MHLFLTGHFLVFFLFFPTFFFSLFLSQTLCINHRRECTGLHGRSSSSNRCVMTEKMNGGPESKKPRCCLVPTFFFFSFSTRSLAWIMDMDMVVYLIEDVGDLDERLFLEIRKRWHTGTREKKEKRIYKRWNERDYGETNYGWRCRSDAIDIGSHGEHAINNDLLYKIRHFSPVVNNGIRCPIFNSLFRINNAARTPWPVFVLRGGLIGSRPLLECAATVQQQQPSRLSDQKAGSVTKFPSFFLSFSQTTEPIKW